MRKAAFWWILFVISAGFFVLIWNLLDPARGFQAQIPDMLINVYPLSLLVAVPSLIVAVVMTIKKRSGKSVISNKSPKTLMRNEVNDAAAESNKNKIVQKLRTQEGQLRIKIDEDNADSLFDYAKYVLIDCDAETKSTELFNEEKIGRACEYFVKAHDMGHEIARSQTRFGNNMRSKWMKYPLINEYIKEFTAAEMAKKAEKAEEAAREGAITPRDRLNRLYAEAKSGDSHSKFLYAQHILFAKDGNEINPLANKEEFIYACDMFFEAFKSGNKQALECINFPNYYNLGNFIDHHGAYLRVNNYLLVGDEEYEDVYETPDGYRFNDAIQELEVKIKKLLTTKYDEALEGGDAETQYTTGIYLMSIESNATIVESVNTSGIDIEKSRINSFIVNENGKIATWIDVGDICQHNFALGMQLLQAAMTQGHEKAAKVVDFILAKIKDNLKKDWEMVQKRQAEREEKTIYEAASAKVDAMNARIHAAIDVKIDATKSAAFTMDGFGNKALANLESQHGISGVGKPSGGGSSSSSSRSTSSSSSTGNANPLFMAAGSEGDRIKGTDSSIVGRHEGGVYKDASGTPRGRLVGDMYQDEHGNTIGWRAGNVILDAQSKQIGRIEGGVIKNDNSETIGRVE